MKWNIFNLRLVPRTFHDYFDMSGLKKYDSSARTPNEKKNKLHSIFKESKKFKITSRNVSDLCNFILGNLSLFISILYRIFYYRESTLLNKNLFHEPNYPTPIDEYDDIEILRAYDSSDEDSEENFFTLNDIPEGQDVIPQAEDVIPQTEDVISQVEVVIPQAEVVIPQAEDVIPQAEDVIPQAEDAWQPIGEFYGNDIEDQLQALEAQAAALVGAGMEPHVLQWPDPEGMQHDLPVYENHHNVHDPPEEDDWQPIDEFYGNDIEDALQALEAQVAALVDAGMEPHVVQWPDPEGMQHDLPVYENHHNVPDPPEEDLSDLAEEDISDSAKEDSPEFSEPTVSTSLEPTESELDVSELSEQDVSQMSEPNVSKLKEQAITRRSEEAIPGTSEEVIPEGSERSIPALSDLQGEPRISEQHAKPGMSDLQPESGLSKQQIATTESLTTQSQDTIHPSASTIQGSIIRDEKTEQTSAVQDQGKTEALVAHDQETPPISANQDQEPMDVADTQDQENIEDQEDNQESVPETVPEPPPKKRKREE